MGIKSYIICFGSICSSRVSYCAARCCSASSGQAAESSGKCCDEGYASFVPAPAKIAALTGTYIFIVGVAVIAAPRSCFGLLFDSR